MTQEPELLQTVIAERRLELLSGTERKITEVVILIGAPEARGDNYECNYQILGLGYDQVRRSMGVDRVQALSLALALIGNALYTNDAWKQGRLTFLGSRDLGFPKPR